MEPIFCNDINRGVEYYTKESRLDKNRILQTTPKHTLIFWRSTLMSGIHANS